MVKIYMPLFINSYTSVIWAKCNKAETWHYTVIPHVMLFDSEKQVTDLPQTVQDKHNSMQQAKSPLTILIF